MDLEWSLVRKIPPFISGSESSFGVSVVKFLSEAGRGGASVQIEGLSTGVWPDERRGTEFLTWKFEVPHKLVCGLHGTGRFDCAVFAPKLPEPRGLLLNGVFFQMASSFKEHQTRCQSLNLETLFSLL